MEFLLGVAVVVITPLGLAFIAFEVGRSNLLSPRAIQGILLCTGLVATSGLVLASAVAWYPKEPECALVFIKVIGCAFGKFENLSGGLLAADAAIFAGWLAWSAVQLQIREEQRRNLASLAVQLDSPLLSAVWAPQPPVPAPPAVLAAPSLQIMNFGPAHPALAVRATLRLESKLPDFQSSTGPFEPTMPQSRQFHVGKSGALFKVNHFYQTIDFKHLTLSRHAANLDVADFIPHDEIRRIGLPESICNELIVYALYKDLFRRSNQENQLAAIDPPLLIAEIEYNQIDGNSPPATTARWTVTSRVLIKLAVDGPEFDLSDDAALPFMVDPGWVTARCELTLKRST
jgi:hypothetical protein